MTSGKGKEAVSGVALMEGSTVPGTQIFLIFSFFLLFLIIFILSSCCFFSIESTYAISSNNIET